MDNKQTLQEQQYTFPYHYIPEYVDLHFKQSKNLFWGYIYISYVNFIVSEISKLPFSSLLDVGCGEGKFLYELKKKVVGKQLAGIDYTETPLLFARAFNPELTFTCDDITSPYYASAVSKGYDIVTLIEVVEHIYPEQLPKFIQAVSTHMKRDGILFLSTPTTNTPLIHKHYQHFTFESLSTLLTPYFEVTQVWYVNKISLWEKIIRRLLGNRFFLLQYQPLIDALYNLYFKYCFNAEKTNGTRIILQCKKKVI